MSESTIYEIELPPKVAELLTTMVSMSKKNQVLTLKFFRVSPMGVRWVSYELIAGEETRTVGQINEDPLNGLQALGLIHNIQEEYHTDSGTIFLTKLAREWVSYNDRNKVSKWLYKVFHSGKDTLLIIVAAFTFALTILQILQLLRLI